MKNQFEKIIVLAIAFFIIVPGLFAQEKARKNDTTQHAGYYTCPMHPEVMTDKPGKCPKCGINRFTLKSTASLAIFTALDLVLQKFGKGALLQATFRKPRNSQ